MNENPDGNSDRTPKIPHLNSTDLDIVTSNSSSNTGFNNKKTSPKRKSTATSYLSFEEAKIKNPVIFDFFNQQNSKIIDLDLVQCNNSEKTGKSKDTKQAP